MGVEGRGREGPGVAPVEERPVIRPGRRPHPVTSPEDEPPVLARLALITATEQPHPQLRELLERCGVDLVLEMSEEETPDAWCAARAVADDASGVLVVDLGPEPSADERAHWVSVLPALRRDRPRMPILILAGEEFGQDREEARVLGALMSSPGAPVGVFSPRVESGRTRSIMGVRDALQNLLANAHVPPKVVAQRLVWANKALNLRKRLTPRQRQVLQLISMGYSNAGAAGKLHIHERGIENHLRSARRHLQIHAAAGEEMSDRELAVLFYLDARSGAWDPVVDPRVDALRRAVYEAEMARLAQERGKHHVTTADIADAMGLPEEVIRAAL